jgi:hypothetical protein
MEHQDKIFAFILSYNLIPKNNISIYIYISPAFPLYLSSPFSIPILRDFLGLQFLFAYFLYLFSFLIFFLFSSLFLFFILYFFLSRHCASDRDMTANWVEAPFSHERSNQTLPVLLRCLVMNTDVQWGCPSIYVLVSYLTMLSHIVYFVAWP